MKISPEPWCAVEPQRARPSPQQAANRSSEPRPERRFVATTAMQLPAGWVGADSGASALSVRPTGWPSTTNRRRSPQLLSTSTPTTYDATSRDALNQLEHVAVPLFIAHGERDERVSPQQGAQLVGRLRELGKRYEYVTYPTEGHGLLRPGPFLHLWPRVERFLDWHLM